MAKRKRRVVATQLSAPRKAAPRKAAPSTMAERVTRNPVAKFDRLVNRAAVQTDRKKAQARGYQKHRSQDLPLSALAA
jgi:hypothetical protein